MSIQRETAIDTGELPTEASLEITWLTKSNHRQVDELVWTVTLLARLGETPVASSTAAWRERGPVGVPLTSAILTECGSNLWHLDVPGFFAATWRAETHQITLLYARCWLLPEDGAEGGCVERPTLRAGAACARILSGACRRCEPAGLIAALGVRP